MCWGSTSNMQHVLGAKILIVGVDRYYEGVWCLGGEREQVEQGQRRWKVHGLSGLKFERTKWDQKMDFSCFLMVAIEESRSSGGRQFHRWGSLLKKKWWWERWLGEVLWISFLLVDALVEDVVNFIREEMLKWSWGFL